MNFLKGLKTVGKYVGKLVLGDQLGLNPPTEGGGSGIYRSEDTLTNIITKVAEQELGASRVGLSGELKRKLVAAVVEQVLLAYFHQRKKKLIEGHDFQPHVEALVGAVADILNDFENDVQTEDVGKASSATLHVIP